MSYWEVWYRLQLVQLESSLVCHNSTWAIGRSGILYSWFSWDLLSLNSAWDAFAAAGENKDGVVILDNDYKAAFNYTVLHCVFKVIKAKGLHQSVIDRLQNIYSNSITIVVVNNILGRSFPNNYWSIRQGVIFFLENHKTNHPTSYSALIPCS